MRRNLCNLFLLPSLSRRGSTSSFAPLLSRSYFIKSSFNGYSKTYRLLGTPNKFMGTTLRNLETIPDDPTQTYIEEKSQLEEGLESAETTDQMFDLMHRVHPSKEREFGIAIINTGLKFYRDGKDPGKALHFAGIVLEVLKKWWNPSLPLARTLQLLGFINYSLKRFDDSLSNLIGANSILDEMECEDKIDNDLRFSVQVKLAKIYAATTGRMDLAIENLKQSLKLKDIEKSELGKVNRELANNYVVVLNFKEALPYCLKALEIHNDLLGQHSVEVAFDRKLLGLVYSGLGEHEKALEQNTFAQRILKNLNLDSDLLQAKIDAANMMITLGRHDEAVGNLKNMVQQTDKDNETRVLVLISMAKALCNQEKFGDCKRCLEVCLGILHERERVSPVEVAKAYTEISMHYETMDEFENAISLLKRALALLERHPQEQPLQGMVYARIGWFLLLTGKMHSATFYLEVATERLKYSLGSRHFGLSYAYNNLGVGYLELDRPMSAVQMFIAAKDIMGVSIGPPYVDAIEARQNLSRALGEFGSSVIAFKVQQKFIDALESHEASTEAGLREARRLLQQLQKKACAVFANANDLPIEALPLPRIMQHLGSPNLAYH